MIYAHMLPVLHTHAEVIGALVLIAIAVAIVARITSRRDK